MSPATINIIIAAIRVISELLKELPALKKSVLEILSKEDPSPSDWDQLRARIAAKNYEDFVPDTAIRPNIPDPQPGWQG